MLLRLRQFTTEAKNKASAGILAQLEEGKIQSSLDSCCDLLKRCRNLEQGKLLHSQTIKNGYEENVFVANLLIQMYARCGSVESACKVFDRIAEPNRFSWTIMISAYAQNGHLDQALQAFRSMVLNGVMPDEVTIVTVLGACEDPVVGSQIYAEIAEDSQFFLQTKAWNVLMSMYNRFGDLDMVERIFQKSWKKNTISWNTVVTAYAQHGHLDKAEVAFESIPEKNVVSWATMITGFHQQGCSTKAFQFFRRMNLEGEKPNRVTFLCILNACLESAESDTDKMVPVILESGYLSHVMIGTALLNVYGKHGRVEAAKSLFDSMASKNSFTWNSMIAAFSKNDRCSEALQTWRLMDLEGVKPSAVTFLCIIDACSSSAEAARTILDRVQAGCGFESELKLGNSLVNMFGKCGLLEEAKCVFHRIANKNVVSWSVAIAAYAENGAGREGLLLFRLMDLEGVQAEEIIYTILADACASIACLREARIIHTEMKSECSKQLRDDPYLANAVINMFGKCGSPDEARSIFNAMAKPDLISWSAMLAAYAENGSDIEALTLFQEMKLLGLKPNKVTFVSVLTACSHAGLLEEGLQQLTSMASDFGVESDADHYICIVDLLARSGRLHDAECLIKEMPFEPDGVAWTTLLGGSRIHGDRLKGAASAQNVCSFEREAKHSANYIMLSQIYAPKC